MAKGGENQGTRLHFLKSRNLFGIAGLYEIWTAHDGQEIRTCTVITTDSNDLVRAGKII